MSKLSTESIFRQRRWTEASKDCQSLSLGRQIGLSALEKTSKSLFGNSVHGESSKKKCELSLADTDRLAKVSAGMPWQ